MCRYSLQVYNPNRRISMPFFPDFDAAAPLVGGSIPSSNVDRLLAIFFARTGVSLHTFLKLFQVCYHRVFMCLCFVPALTRRSFSLSSPLKQSSCSAV